MVLNLKLQKNVKHLITLQYFLELCWQIIYVYHYNNAFIRNRQSLLFDFIFDDRPLPGAGALKPGIENG